MYAYYPFGYIGKRLSNVNANAQEVVVMRSPAPPGLQMSPGKSLTTHKDALYRIVSLSFERGS